MTKNRVFGRPLPDASVPRNAFDMSKRINLQMPFGAIIPCYAHQYIAGSHVKIKVDTFFRTARVNTAAFPRLKMETEFFAVPIRYLWSYWDDFKLGIQDKNSTALYDSDGDNNPSEVPSFDIFSFWRDIDAESLNTNYYDSVGMKWYLGARRLLEGLGYGRFPLGLAPDATDHPEYVQKLNLFKALAYQKVYYDHFRNTAYESNDPFAYNADHLFSAGDSVTSALLRKIFTLRYANYRKDYFQHIFPALNYVMSTPVQAMSSVPGWIQGISGGSFSGTVGNSSTYRNRSDSGLANGSLSLISGASVATVGGDSKEVMHTHNYGSLSVTPMSVQAIRAAFALDKLQRSSAYAPKHVKDQYEARYGIKFSSKSSYESYKIGSFDTDITIGEVVSTANTSGVSGDYLGDIGGKGLGASDPKAGFIEFTCPEDCIVIGVNYAIPRTMYDSARFDNWNCKLSQEDFFIPEFENMGLKPVYQKELSFVDYDSAGRPFLLNFNEFNIPLGFQTPYMEYKCDIDENRNLFADPTSDLGQFTVHSNLSAHPYPSGGVSLTYFKVKPTDLDTIFFAQADGTESTDHLFGEMTFTVAVNQNMSVHGQPSL